MAWKSFMEAPQRARRSHGALDVAVVDHDVAERFRGVQRLVPAIAAVVLVGRERAVVVLQRQDHVDRVLEARRTYEVLPEQRLQAEHRLEALGGAVRNGPAVGARGERPAALRDVPEGGLAESRRFVGKGRRGLGLRGRENLRLFEVAQSTFRTFAVVRNDFGRRLDEGLREEGRVPALRPVVALHLHAVLGDPQIIRNPETVPRHRDVAVRPLLIITRHDQVVHLVDGPDAHVVGLLVLGVRVARREGDASCAEAPPQRS
mmetsp:Transcript_4989/g.15675  ORF Transcript_4989/g.15675 Transcript_4989/m.15675 type:complete len:261 (-) Transcript_4989:893-1675(-)